MSQKKKQRYRGKRTGSMLPFSSENYVLFAVGILVIILGYLSLSRGPWNSFWSLTLAPILLVIGYCIIVPVAILYRKRNNKQEAETK